MAPHIILASASPQRKTLLTGLGVIFDVIPSEVDEEAFVHTDPRSRALELAHLKAVDVAARYPESFVIGCDTLVVAHDGTLLEKAVDEADARRMLQLQSGHVSEVHSGLCVINPEGDVSKGISSSEVKFRELSDADRDWWMSTNLWQNRSGSFQIDGLGQLMIEWIRGDWTSIVGLPVYQLGVQAREVGLHIGPQTSAS